MIDYNNILLDSFNNKAILAPMLAWFVTQTIKVGIAAMRKRKFDFALYFVPGGFPSSHSAAFTALCVVVAALSGVNSIIFAITLFMTIFVLYDASVLRRAAEKQAQSLNDLIEFINIKEMEPLREVLGHSWLEVLAGSIIGIAIGIFVIF